MMANPEVIKAFGSSFESIAVPKFVTNPKAQTRKASRINTSPLRNFGITADPAARKTMASAAVVACRGEK